MQHAKGEMQRSKKYIDSTIVNPNLKSYLSTISCRWNKSAAVPGEAEAVQPDTIMRNEARREAKGPCAFLTLPVPTRAEATRARDVSSLGHVISRETDGEVLFKPPCYTENLKQDTDTFEGQHQLALYRVQPFFMMGDLWYIL